MKWITSERLFVVLAVGALVGWSMHFYRELERPAVGVLEAAFGGWSILPLSVVFVACLTIVRIRAKSIVADPPRFYEKGASRYVLVALTLAVFLGFIFLGIRGHA